MKKLMPLLLGATVVVAGCNSTAPQQSGADKSAEAPQRKAAAYLSETEAMRRSARVSDVAYTLNFKLSNEEVFQGSTTIDLNLLDNSADLTVDLNSATINSLKINGKIVTPDYNQWFITIDKDDLKKGNNRFEIDYSRQHSTNGEGLHRFKDPVDGKVYLYSHFEPAAAQQMFPSFDQPDIKATYKLNVTAPKDWYVISAQPETSITESDQNKRWDFPVTPKLSTYNFSMHAGPYKMWQDTTGKYPARLFARQSVAEQIHPDMWFKFTRQGFEFFEQYFDIPYPFKKYDQVLVPDFLYGAMENAGAVTFDERSFLSRGSVSKGQQESLAQTILHEMAHQWFGNLVTMKWWNGLWLNESFAAYMHYLSTAEATEFDNAWRTFYIGRKQSAYSQDQMITTHPIEVPVPTTGNAFDNIDAITYAKGASVLRQLSFYLGQDVFRQGIRNYLKKYAYQNATLDDFVNSLAQAAGRDLSEFKQQWLYHAGVNSIEADYQCDNGKISSFNIKQSAPSNHPILRQQHVNIALFNLTDGKLAFNKASPITYSGETTEVSALIGEQCPDMVYPNYQDWGFVKVNLDEKSFATIKSSINTVDDTLLRAMLWQSLSDSVSDGKLPMNDFIDVLMTHALNERDYTIMRQLSGKIRGTWYYLNLFGDEFKDYRHEKSKQFEAIAWQALEEFKDNSGFQRIWFGILRSVATNKASLDKFAAMLKGDFNIPNLTINQDYRWSLVQMLSRYDYPGAAELIEQELQRDNSDSGQKQAIAAKAASPDPKVKAYWVAEFASDTPEYPFPLQRYAMGALFPSNQGDLAEQYADQLIESLADIDKRKPPTFMRTYVYSLVLDVCTEKNLKRLEKASKNTEGLSEIARRGLLYAQHSTKECLKVRRQMTR